MKIIMRIAAVIQASLAIVMFLLSKGAVDTTFNLILMVLVTWSSFIWWTDWSVQFEKKKPPKSKPNWSFQSIEQLISEYYMPNVKNALKEELMDFIREQPPHPVTASFIETVLHKFYLPALKREITEFAKEKVAMKDHKFSVTLVHKDGHQSMMVFQAFNWSDAHACASGFVKERGANYIADLKHDCCKEEVKEPGTITPVSGTLKPGYLVSYCGKHKNYFPETGVCPECAAENWTKGGGLGKPMNEPEEAAATTEEDFELEGANSWLNQYKNRYCEKHGQVYTSGCYDCLNYNSLRVMYDYAKQLQLKEQELDRLRKKHSGESLGGPMDDKEVTTQLLEQELDRLRKKHSEELDVLIREVKSLREQKDNTCLERDSCVAALAKLAVSMGWTAGLGRHEESDTEWEDEWRNIVYIDFPTGQASWHIHDKELVLFNFLKPYEGKWDGHSTREKYLRLSELQPKDDRMETLKEIADIVGKLLDFSVPKLDKYLLEEKLIRIINVLRLQGTHHENK